MADIITNAKTVLVRLTSAAKDGRSITLDNPNENITLAQIKQAFQPILETRLLLGNKGDNLDAVESATVTTTQKIKLGDSDTEITVSPNVLTFRSSSSSVGATFTITGSNVIGGYFADIDFGTVVLELYKITPNESNNTLSIEAQLSASPTVINSGTFNIVTAARTIQIPIELQ